MMSPRLIGAILALLAIALFIGWLWSAAGDATRNQVERQNNEAAKNSDDARSGFDACPVGLWDFASGRCKRP